MMVPERQGQNLAMTVLHVPCSLNSGGVRGYIMSHWLGIGAIGLVHNSTSVSLVMGTGAGVLHHAPYLKAKAKIWP